jgi:RHS repeat-associated protein
MERDTVTGLNLAVYREENPGTGRWNSQDPLGFLAADSDLYRYVGNSASNRTDVSGLVDWSKWPEWLSRNTPVKTIEKMIKEARKVGDWKKLLELRGAKKILQQVKRLAEKLRGRGGPRGGGGARCYYFLYTEHQPIPPEARRRFRRYVQELKDLLYGYYFGQFW